MKKGAASSSGKSIFKNIKVQEAYEELKEVVEEKKVDVMKLFL